MNEFAEIRRERPESTSGRLLEAREYIGLSVAVAAEALGVDESEVFSLEAGCSAPTDAELTRMAALYRRPVWWLTGGSRRVVEFGQRLSDRLAELPEQDRDTVIGFAEFLADAGQPAIPQR